MSLVESKIKYFSVVTISVGSFLLASHAILRTVNRWRLVFISRRLLGNLSRKIQEPLSSTSIVSSHVQWDSIYSVIRSDCERLPVLGFDCEWVSMKGTTQPVALIQLATYSGTCALVRVNCMGTLPVTLKAILTDPSILKVGVATWEDSLKVARDLETHMKGVVDVRYLLHHWSNGGVLPDSQGLSGLSKTLLDIQLPKHFSVRCSDWEAEQLSADQVSYAAKDALASLAIYLKLVQSMQVKRSRQWFFIDIRDVHETSFSVVRKFVDRKYHSNKKGNPTAVKNAQAKVNTNPLTVKSRAYAARKTPLYDNCILQAPDGQVLCTCDSKKAQWYVSKGRGELISQNPPTVRLNFEPSGRPSTDYDAYYLMEKSNQCVVCGKSESYLRKNVVPHEYRRHFPAVQKDHKSHDILLLCDSCHAQSSTYDGHLRAQLALDCEAPIGTERDVKVKLDRGLSSVQKAARALLHNRSSIPAARIAELEKVIREFYGVEQVTNEVLEAAHKLEANVENPDYVPHGLKVVRFYEEKDGVLALEKKWRCHFLDTMKPQFLPAMWSVDHHRKPEEDWKTMKTLKSQTNCDQT